MSMPCAARQKKQTSMLVLRSPEDFVPQQHPIRRIKKVADEILRSLTSTLEAMYAERGRPSIPLERLLKATILMALYTAVGLAKNKLAGFMVAAAYNLLRIAKLLPLPDPA
jgi:hypothetical protein